MLMAALMSVTAACSNASAPDYEYGYLYKDLPFDMPQVYRPQIADYDVNIVDFGAVGDAVTKNTEAFAKAIEAATANKGGGRVVVPGGVWLTGPITLKDNVELFLAHGALIVFSGDSRDYELISTSFEGLETRRAISPINATGAKNIAITGYGTIDGSGDEWRPVKKSKMTPSQWKMLVSSGGVLNDKKDYWFPSAGSMKGFEMSDMNVPRKDLSDEEWYEIRDFLRPVMVSLRECENVLLQGVTFQNSPSWNIHPLMCTNMIVDGVTIRNPWYAQNGDGIDFESCTNVLMINSTLDVGDDAVCIKSGKDEDGRRRAMPCQNIIVDNCIVFHGHGGFVVGSEMSGGVKNVSVTNCQFLGTDVGLRFKSARGRGGVVENIHISNVSMANIAAEPLLFDLFYGGKSAVETLEDGDEVGDNQMIAVDETTPQFKDIYISGVACRGARRAMLFNGLPEMPVQNVNVSNCRIYSTLGAEVNNSAGVTLTDILIVNSEGPALLVNDVNGLTVDDFRTGENSKIKVSGSRNTNIVIRSSDLSASNSVISDGAKNAVRFE